MSKPTKSERLERDQRLQRIQEIEQMNDGPFSDDWPWLHRLAYRKLVREETAFQQKYGPDEGLVMKTNGKKNLGAYAWHVENAEGKLHPVGQKLPNGWGLYDMHGLVWEWVQDWYAWDYYQRSPRDNPRGPESGVYPVVRGGGWINDAVRCRSACRYRYDPAVRGSDLGFRLARTGPWPSYPFTLEPEKPPEPPAEEKAEKTYEPYEVFRDGAEMPEMVYLPGGIFQMGDIQGDGSDRERPVHQVTLDAFAIGRYPVTVGEYLRFVEATGRNYPEWLQEGSIYHIETGIDDYYAMVGIDLKETRHPITGVSWNDARAYCEWLSEQTGERYSLPTEAQWEYACRASSTTRYCFDNE